MGVGAQPSSAPSGQVDDAPAVPAPDPRPELHINAGLGYARRAFDYQMDGASNQSPSIRSAAPEIAIDGDIYPFALANPKSPVAHLGFALAYDQVVGSTVHTQTSDRDIDQSYFSVGARYRFDFDRHSIALGLDYVHQQYVVEHAAYQAQIAGVPDITYTALAPNVSGRFAVASDTTLVASLAGWLVLDAGQITDLDQYGKARVLGLTATGGTEFALAEHVNLSILFEYTRIGLDFEGVGAMAHGVSGATDETAGVVATLGLQY